MAARFIAHIGLGSNLENPRRQVETALAELDGLPLTRRVAASRLYASRPVGPQDQPDFVNAVATLETALSPLALLDQLQALEQRHRRRRERHWGPRTLDLDLLWMANITLALPRLTLPHPELAHRAFVVLPLAELDPALSLADGRALDSLAQQMEEALHRGDLQLLTASPVDG
ncbi:2-amino-4-hydroxy-6-hydroxymethyldihydropteridine diphosphokinase [Halomonas sp. DP8Y7-1]|uniref:2-amino-4-hydroxy-6- hydroxymethyldihydropteridine diphosphokinase n=1 Tax=unclassified Halomonas TaxID=2609666 RepID=UPI001C977D79|nr:MULTISPECIES: 2-amino-4-hydroxy-6-hydroxymethyldihydropteridine diphosphokinase [unclassified Halomonas]MBY5928523.1 2-amino-4-hydroxy-6-hydroxymethyldihydropteridine diphosphokinase [Halomonas sp. DP8Y7-3]MBY6028650.1 2-amino-4-hydroxy-6-hydroxymethyldihydropteridine diphosphokinase [Halomonas sp. DP8Y7-1]